MSVEFPTGQPSSSYARPAVANYVTVSGSSATHSRWAIASFEVWLQRS